MPDFPKDLQERLAAALAGRYHIVGTVGAGGMAIVFRAQDLKHDRPVAIKVLKPELAEAVWSDRFLREIQIASRLQHPHIVPLYDSGEADDTLYYVMPFITGESLRARLAREGPLPVAEALRLAREVAEGLRHAHAQGVVHRDIKPENILLAEGHVLVCDFGIARALTLAAGDAPTPTQPGLALGTPSYMSPEQCSAAGDLDARSDIYSLGCMLFEMLAGEPPFRGRNALALMAQHTTARPPALRRFRSDVPIGVEAAIERAMAKLPEKRFATAADLLSVLESPSGVFSPAHRPPAAAIAVLPFANLSGDPESEYLSDGISEELIQTLSQVPGLQVVARTTAFALKGKREDVREIGHRLRVDTVLDGSIRVAGDRIKVAAQLIDAAEGFQLWSAQYERRAGNSFALEDEIARTIAEVLKHRLAGQPDAAPTPPVALAVPRRDAQAHEAYLKGRHHWNKRTEGGIVRSIEWFEQAIARCPDDPAFHSALANAHLTLGIYGVAPPDQVMPKAKAAAEQALVLYGRAAEAHAALATVCALFEWDWPGAEHHFRLATELDPAYPTGHQWCAMHLLAPLRRFDEARRQLDRARALDPLSPAILTSVGVLSFFTGDHDRAIAELEEVLELDPGFAAAHYFLGQTRLRRSEPDAARSSLTRAAMLSGESVETVAGLAYADAVTGRQAEARAALEQLGRRAEGAYVSPIRLAQIHLGLGDEAKALDWLARGLECRAAEAVWLGVHPVYDPVRRSPQFASMLEQIGLGGGGGVEITRVAFTPRRPPTSVAPGT
ncbi:MAG TPA: protein kinase [Gemmatimonadales bacterium]|nr:protein kinase [Gemmatimonadales bacterium]